MNSFNWIVAETNTPSIKVAEALGLELAEKFMGEIHAKGETGEWRRYVQYRDESMKGILQGEQSLAAWTGVRNASALDAILKANAEGDVEKTMKLAQDEMARIVGEDKSPTDDRNKVQKALDQRAEDMAKRLQQLANRHGRVRYNEELRRRKKRRR